MRKLFIALMMAGLLALLTLATAVPAFAAHEVAGGASSVSEDNVAAPEGDAADPRGDDGSKNADGTH